MPIKPSIKFKRLEKSIGFQSTDGPQPVMVESNTHSVETILQMYFPRLLIYSPSDAGQWQQDVVPSQPGDQKGK